MRKSHSGQRNIVLGWGKVGGNEGGKLCVKETRVESLRHEHCLC